MASRLRAAAVMLADIYEEGRWHLLKRSLPPVARRLADDVWMERFVFCFDALARRFERRQVDTTQIATWTAEEMALHLVIEEAEGTAATEAWTRTSHYRRTQTVTRTSAPFGSSSSATTTFCCSSMAPSTRSRRRISRSANIASSQPPSTGLVPAVCGRRRPQPRSVPPVRKPAAGRTLVS
jgi:hypothetical protein